MGPGGHNAPSRPTAWATIAAVSGASPVTITVRTPSVFSSVTRAAESSRAGSLSAINPKSCVAPDGPAATANTRNPFVSNSFATPGAVGDGLASAPTVANTPLIIRSVPKLGSPTVASDILVAGSKGTK